jgi:hypothetical protein
MLNTANNVKIGSQNVDRIYLDGIIVWPQFGETLWTFDSQPATLTSFALNFSNPSDTSTVFWGDLSSDNISNNQPINHIYYL